MSSKDEELLALVEKLTGQRVPNQSPIPPRVIEVIESGIGLGHSQFNELLLLLGYDRVCDDLFQFIADGTIPYRTGSSIRSVAQLHDGVTRFRKLALLFFGNVKFAFKRLGNSPSEVEQWAIASESIDEETFRKRHEPIQPIEPIPPSETYLLGYLIEAELAERLRMSPSDAAASALEAQRQTVVEQGRRNHSAYLVSDHLDVYVATSMRETHEYLAVNSLCNKIFSQPNLKPLNLRWFDPTQAYCPERIDKGLAEALMLKRARCTLYLAQETDTLGKDSELASTLAQGKPVIAYVPVADEAFVDELLAGLRTSDPGLSEAQLLMKQLQLFEPGSAWKEPEVMRWASDESYASTQVAAIKSRLTTAVTGHYEKRAEMLKNRHPLGIQVNLLTGVANGVLVARTEESCAELIRRIVTSTMEFKVVDTVKSGTKYVFLEERLTGCVFRVMTGDQHLTNAFWNFYLQTPS